jgi:hypothetical protein
MTKPARPNYFPRAPLFGMFALEGFALVAAIVGRITGGEVLHGTSTPVAERDLRFADRADGRLTLDDPSTGRHVELVAFGPDNEAVFAWLLTVMEGSL